MKKIEVSTIGDQITISKFLGISQQAVNNSISRKNSKRHDQIMQMLADLKKSRIRVMNKHAKRESINNILS